MLELGFKVFASYLLGSINGALLVGRVYGDIDIRQLGSGNAGGTNALRTQGKLFALLVMVIDVGKGVLPVLVLPALVLPGIDPDPLVSRDWLIYACAGAAVFGHCYPVWHGFAGGKGAATALGVLLVAAPAAVLPAMLTWFTCLLLAGYVGLATVLATWAIPAALLVLRGTGDADIILFTALLAGFISFTHRSNLHRLLTGAAQPDVRFSLLHRSG